jgi:2-haloacid dehalogenase
VTSSLRVRAVLLDVNETLSDTSALSETFTAVGAPGSLAPTWFAAVLRDGFALSAVRAAAPFADVARTVGRTVLASSVPEDQLEDALDQVVAAMGKLPLHPDVPGGLRALAGAGLRLATLTNGSTKVSDQLLSSAGVREAVERLLSVQDAPGGAWKPVESAYHYALEEMGVEASETVLVAVHPWDVDGAHRAGLRTAWVNRSGVRYPEVFSAPDVTVSSVEELTGVLQQV